MKPVHYCTNPRCQLCRAVDVLNPSVVPVRDDVESGEVWPEDEEVVTFGWPEL